jgi:hypothetical protein
MQVLVFESQKLALAQSQSAVQVPPLATMGVQTKLLLCAQYKPSSSKQTVGTEVCWNGSDNQSSPLAQLE